MWSSPPKEGEGVEKKSTSNSVSEKVEADGTQPELNDRNAKVNWNKIDEKSKKFFDIAGRAARTEDGEESMIDRVLLDHAADQKKDNDSLLKRKELSQAKTVVQLLQQMVSHEDVFGSESSSEEEDDRYNLLTSTNTVSSGRERTSKSLLKSINSGDDLLGEDAKEFIRRIIAAEFPQSIDPTLANLISVGASRTGSAYKPSEWVEILGQDMKYRLEMITRVLKLSPPEWDWNAPENVGKEPDWVYFYHAGDKRMVEADEVRSPKEGLVRIFGQRPWIWQQWACLKLEHTLRFQEGHQTDFMSFDVPKYALELWERWLHDPRNHEFCQVYNDDRVGDRGRHELINHIMSPFNLVDQMKEDHEEWDFEGESRFSVFTYLGMLGSGYLIPVAIIFLQAAIPGILVWNLLDTSAQSRAEGECAGLTLFGYSSECPRNPVAQAMALVVLFFYLFKVVPDTFNSFYETAGTGSSVYSRLVSLRREIWFRGDDRPEQQLGFRMDIYMNTGYVDILFMLNIFIIINTDDAFEILLNALAFEFVINLDEEFVKSVWWDPKKRWIVGGSMELVLQSVLQQSGLSNAERFEEVFGIPNEKILTATDGDPNLFKCPTLAEQDQENTKFMTNDEIVKHLCKKVAIETNNLEAITEYKKPRVFFGSLVSSIRSFSGVKGGGAFDRYPDFRTWSRWEKVLHMAEVPNIDKILTVGETNTTVVNKDLAGIVSTEKNPFENLDKDYLAGKKDWEVFAYYCLRVLTFQYFVHFCSPAWKKRKYFAVILRALDSFLQWLSFFIQIIFPLYTGLCVLGLGANLVGIASDVAVV